MPTGLPERTIGWHILAWCSKYIRQPDGEHAGEPWRFTREQAHHVLWLYALDDKGRFAYRRAVLRRSKGWGKSPLLAALAIVEFIGPCRPDPKRSVRDPMGNLHPAGRPESSPLVQMAAVSVQQAYNTMDAVRAMLVESPAVRDYNLDVGKTMVQFGDGRPGKIEPVTASTASLEGARPTFVVADEIHHWSKGTGGFAMAAVLSRNLGKRPGGMARMVMTTNAHSPGEGTVGEQEYEAFLDIKSGKAKRTTDVLYDCVEAPPDVDMVDEDSLRESLRVAYGDSVWVDLDRVISEIYDPTSDPSEMRRFYLNHVVAASDAWLDPAEVDAATLADAITPDGGMIALGFDGAKSDDSTAIVATDVESGHAFVVGVWEKPDGPDAAGWTVPRDEVDRAVRDAFERWDVVAFFADVAYWESYLDLWSESFREGLFIKASPKHSVAFDMRTRLRDFTRAAEFTHAAFAEGALTIDPHPILIRHLKNSRRRPNNYGVGFGKTARESPFKVDAAAAMVLAREARRVSLEAGVMEKRARMKPGEFFSF
ncbi:terminase large subunit [Kitasatospora purpeofusca]|uniref:terminase large subunit n=1 Tax=Kitasatospora purpeofusca TaxID=67352 RepID=UPI0022505C9A|nr:terminase large subunit [Kitasatospora purpeofusca]MCX4687286.1 terminase large subunit [Kitasatospora purpeofusca]